MDWHRDALRSEQSGGKRVGRLLRASPSLLRQHKRDFSHTSVTQARSVWITARRSSPPKDPQTTLSSQHHRLLRLPIKDPDHSGSVAVVLPQKATNQNQAAELIASTEEEVEVIKVYLEAQPEVMESFRMLTDEVSQIQEVRYCLKSLREQMAARQNNNNNKYPTNGFRGSSPVNQSAVSTDNVPSDSTQLEDDQEESTRLREATRRLYAQLKEMEKQHQEERDRLEAESKEYRVRLAEQSERLQAAERLSGEKSEQVEELQRLLGNMVVESGLLKDKMAAGEAELLQLKANKEEGAESERCAELEKEVAVLKEKIHHLDDMLKSQQRKIRHMIEQLQNSRIVLQERDRVIGDLRERVAFLDAENKEMRDHMEYLLAGQDPLPLSRNKPEIVYSKPLTPTSPTNKVLPFIKVIEIKS